MSADEQMRDIRSRVLGALAAPLASGDADFDALATGSMAMAFGRLFPESPLYPRTDLRTLTAAVSEES